MIKISVLRFRRVLHERRGQALYWAIFGMIPFLAMAGLTIDVGHAYIIQSALQNGTNAAALAAAGYMITGQTQTAAADAYGSYTGGANPVPYVTAAPVVQAVCLNILNPGDTGCGSTTNNNAPPACNYASCNAVKVTQQASVPTYFLNVVGWKYLNVQATAYSSNAGPALPWNLAIIVDTTGSMADTDPSASSCHTTSSKEECALEGIQVLLSGFNPCPVPLTSCNNDTASFHVALFAFPNMLPAALPIATQCSGTVSVADYTVATLPKPGLPRYHPDTDLVYQQTYTPNGATKPTTTQWWATYEITYGAADAAEQGGTVNNGFVSDYFDYSNTATGQMNPSSSLVQAVGYGTTALQPNGTWAPVNGATTSKTGCLPVSPSSIDLNTAVPNPGSAPGAGTIVNKTGVGEGVTYYAPVIYAAQAALTSEAVLHPGQNAIIFLGDGAQNTQWIYFPEGTLLQDPPMAANNTLVPSKIVPNSAECPNALYPADTINTTQNACGYDTTLSMPSYTALAAALIPTSTGPKGEANTNPPTGTPPGRPISGLYPDFLDQCQQAVMAAQYAASQGTKIFSVAYGSDISGCISGNKTDDYNDITAIGGFSLSAPVSPCWVMQNMANNPQATTPNSHYFYSDYSVNGSGCQSSANTMTSMDSIFWAIRFNMAQARLLPGNAT